MSEKYFYEFTCTYYDSTYMKNAETCTGIVKAASTKKAISKIFKFFGETIYNLSIEETNYTSIYIKE